MAAAAVAEGGAVEGVAAASASSNAAAMQAWVAAAFERAGIPGRQHQIDAVSELLMAVQADDTDEDVDASSGSNSNQQQQQQQQQQPVQVTAAAPAPAAQRPRNFLLQHSAGSGKSLTIAALVHGLLQSWKGGAGSKLAGGAGRSSEHSTHSSSGFGVVLIVNDRLQLDAQLGNTVAAFLSSAFGFGGGSG